MSVFRAILFSLTLHFLITGAIMWLSPEVTPPQPETIEVTLTPEQEILEALTPKKKQIVRQAPLPEKLRAPDDETLARFLSEKNQRVKEEMQAAKSGMSANRSNQEVAAAIKPAQKKLQPSHSLPAMDKDGFHTVDISKELQELNRLDEGMSTVGESLPRDMKVGSFTALNTDRYVFYTFYARLEELTRFRWETKVQEALQRFDRPMLVQNSDRNWVTHIEFLLDKKGFLQKSLIMKSSGIPSFDRAAVEAFQDARVFPNPPAEMIQDDGFIHIKFSFNVNYLPPVFVKRN